MLRVLVARSLEEDVDGTEDSGSGSYEYPDPPIFPAYAMLAVLGCLVRTASCCRHFARLTCASQCDA